MTRVVAVLLAAFFGAQVPTRDGALRPTSGGGITRGRVVADDSGDPLRNAIVTLEAAANVGPVLTDAEGRFTIEGAPHGLHTVSASKTGYAAADLRLADGIEIRLLRGSAFSGRVLDDFGEPSALRTVVAERLVRVE